MPTTTTTTATTTAPLHSNPRIARALADHNAAPGKYGSAAALCRAHGITDKATARQLRQVLRDAGMGVGRGNVYRGITTAKVASAAKRNAAQAKRNAAQATPAS